MRPLPGWYLDQDMIRMKESWGCCVEMRRKRKTRADLHDMWLYIQQQHPFMPRLLAAQARRTGTPLAAPGTRYWMPLRVLSNDPGYNYPTVGPGGSKWAPGLRRTLLLYRVCTGQTLKYNGFLTTTTISPFSYNCSPCP